MLKAGTGPDSTIRVGQVSIRASRHSPTSEGRDISQPRTTANRTYRHEALLWRDVDEFLSSTLPFISDGLAAEEPVMVAVVAERTAWLRDALGSDADDVLFVDMAELGRNPARIIPAWRDFVEQHQAASGSAVRGIGEPIWRGRRAEEIAESQLHEALLNVAVDPDTPFWLMCPYDARLDDEVIEEVYRSHPAVIAGGEYRGSHLYGGRSHVTTVFGQELPALGVPTAELTFTASQPQGVSSFVAIKAYGAGLAADRAANLAVAASELVANSIQRGAVCGTISLWIRDDAVICEVRDAVATSDPLTGRKATGKDHRRGQWVANQLSDLVQLRSTASGTTVRVHAWL
jgi:hypothetical protein